MKDQIDDLAKKCKGRSIFNTKVVKPEQIVILQTKNIFLGKKLPRLRRKGLNLVKLRPNHNFGRTEAEPNTSAEAKKKLRPKPKLRWYTSHF